MNTTQSFCLHAETRAVAMPPGSRHWRALECAHCCAHLRFLPWPEHLQQRKENLRKYGWILKSGVTRHMSIEEEMFLDEAVMDTAGRLSPAQQARFDEICAKYDVPDNAVEMKGDVR